MFLISCNSTPEKELSISIFETSAAGNKLTQLSPFDGEVDGTISLDTTKTYQHITGFGGSFTESSAYLLNQMSPEKRKEILSAYFTDEGARYSLTRTHMSSCDFSLDHYSYAPVENDTALIHFSIDEDRDDIIPMIKEAQAISSEGFKIVASPWTAPPWMKDNQAWYSGKLKKEFYPTWANFFAKYAKAYEKEGIDIWAFTVENEALGNDSSFESMEYTPEETADFVKNFLSPTLTKENIDVNILVYDHNRGKKLEEWADVLLNDEELKPLIYGTAIHWYAGTVSYFPESLNFTHNVAPEKHIINTEGCVDSEIPHWQDDDWYWKKEATDWGWTWASEEEKPQHPKYVPVYRYARDIIGCLNNWVEGWIDWNMVLDENGGPNLVENWCVAPVLVNVQKDEVYYTPLYYTLSHFSKFIRPGAVRIGFDCSDKELMTTAIKNIDGSIVIVVLNMSAEKKKLGIDLGEIETKILIDKQALQTILIKG
jgi:glucosylceramidase